MILTPTMSLIRAPSSGCLKIHTFQQNKALLCALAGAQAWELHAPEDSYECAPTQNHKTT